MFSCVEHAVGYNKDREIAQDEQGWRYSGSTICFRCLLDPYLRDLVKGEANRFECTFFGWRKQKRANSIPFNRLMQVIAEAIFQSYSHVEDEGIAYDSEDDQYIGQTYDTWDLVHDEIAEPTDRDDVVREIIDSLGDHLWCDKRPYALTESERYESSWEKFCDTVKHHVRFLFLGIEAQKDEEYSETIPVPDMLDALCGVIEEAGLTGTLAEGTAFFRVRAHLSTERCDSWRSLGSPPSVAALGNRMSPAGISMFYAAADIDTAYAEVLATRRKDDERVLTGARWTSTRPMHVLDLTALPEAPSFYARLRYEREELSFLHEFVRNISQPVAPDLREHTEYVPTQIPTEYFVIAIALRITPASMELSI